MKLLHDGLLILAAALVAAGCVVGLAGLGGPYGAGAATRILAAFFRFVVLAATGTLLAVGAQRCLKVASSAVSGRSRSSRNRKRKPRSAAAGATANPPAGGEAPAQKQEGAAAKTSASSSSKRRRRGGQRRRTPRSTSTAAQGGTGAPGKAGTDQRKADGEPPGAQTRPAGPVRLADVVYPSRAQNQHDDA